MCNFIIRPIKSYATIDVTASDGQAIKTGEFVEVTSVESDGTVNGKHMGNDPVSFSMSVFTHTFSDKDPNKKKDSKESK